jgi:hypothetical protein
MTKQFKGFQDYRIGTATLLVNNNDYSRYIQPGSSPYEQSLIPVFGTENPNIDAIINISQITLRQSQSSASPIAEWSPLYNPDFKVENTVTFTRGSVIVKARIQKASEAFFNRETCEPEGVVLDLTDKLGLINRDFPVPSPRGYTSGGVAAAYAQGVTYNRLYWFDDIVRKLTTPTNASGVAYFSAAQIDTTGLPTTTNATDFAGAPLPDGFDTAQDQNRNPVISAAKVAALRGYLLYCDPATEVVKFEKYPLTPGEKPASRMYPPGAVELSDPEKGTDPAIDAAEVTAIESTRTDIRLKKRFKDWPLATPIKGAHPTTGAEIDVETRTEQAPNKTETSSTQSYSITRAKFYGFPAVESLKSDTSSFTAETGTIVSFLNDSGLPTREGLSILNRAKGIWNSEQFPGDTNPVNNCSELTYYTYDSEDGRLTLKRKRIFHPLTSEFTESNDTTVLEVKRLETVYDLRADGKIATWDRQFILRGKTLDPEDPTETDLVLDPSFTSEVRLEDAIQAPTGLVSDNDPPQIQRFTGNASANSNGSTGGFKARISLVGAGKAGASLYARVAVAKSQHSLVTRPVSRPLEDDENLAPAQVEVVGKFDLLKDGLRIEFQDKGGIKLEYSGLQMAKRATAFTVPKRPFKPESETLTLATPTAATGSSSFMVGVPVQAIQLISAGGTKPCTFTALSGLPSGLSLSSSGLLTGTPTTAATGSISLQVEDDDSDTATASLSYAIIAYEAGAAHYGFNANFGSVVSIYSGLNLVA